MGRLDRDGLAGVGFPLGGEGGIILLDKNGDVHWDFNSTGMFRGFKKSSGETKIEMFEKPE